MAVAYLILVFVKRKYVGWVMTFFTLSCLTYAHIARMVRNYGSWDLDIATGLMLLCIHLCAVAWDYVDGEVDPAKLSTEQKKNALKERPTLLELFSSGVCPTQCFAGPSSNFADYKDYIYHRGIYADVPNTFVPCMKRFLLGWVFVVFYVGIHKFFTNEQLCSPQFPSESFFTRVCYRSPLASLPLHDRPLHQVQVLHRVDDGGISDDSVGAELQREGERQAQFRPLLRDRNQGGGTRRLRHVGGRGVEPQRTHVAQTLPLLPHEPRHQ